MCVRRVGLVQQYSGQCVTSLSIYKGQDSFTAQEYRRRQPNQRACPRAGRLWNQTKSAQHQSARPWLHHSLHPSAHGDVCQKFSPFAVRAVSSSTALSTATPTAVAWPISAEIEAGALGDDRANGAERADAAKTFDLSRLRRPAYNRQALQFLRQLFPTEQKLLTYRKNRRYTESS